MFNTKEKILIAALHLFSQNGYEAVSVSQIAGELAMVKSALYKHYKNKRDILDSIVQRMQEKDCENAHEHSMPENTIKVMPEEYKGVSVEHVKKYTLEQFDYWTKEDFPSCFRKMLTLEQFRNDEFSKLYHQYICTGPVLYMADIFKEKAVNKQDAYQLALEFYAPMFILYSIYDGAKSAKEKRLVRSALKKHIENFMERKEKNNGK